MQPILNVELVPSVQLPISFFNRSTTAMAMLREDGLLLYQNEAAFRMFNGIPGRPDMQVGMNLRDWGPKDFSAERIAIMRRLALLEQDGLIRDIWQGEQVLTHLRLLPRKPGEELRVFLTVHERTHGPLSPADFPGAEFHEGEAQDLGPLALLSPRELEVLALVGEGLTASQIAARIHRTEETVNSHKAALLRKLGCQNATQLALVSYKAGLKFNDASRLRP